jgi:hypothetical protein
MADRSDTPYDEPPSPSEAGTDGMADSMWGGECTCRSRTEVADHRYDETSDR